MGGASAGRSQVTRREFDQIAPVYDASRGPMAPEVVDRLAEVLRERGCRSLLEVGVGTGRVAQPLLDRGFLVTGLDASREMLARAKAKGIERLARGNAYALPFRTDSFDSSLLVHVLHLFDEPGAALREGARVGRGHVMALLVERCREAPAATPGHPSPHEVLRELFEEAGLAPPRFTRPSDQEREVLLRVPPDEMKALCDRTVVESFERRLSWMETGADRSTLKVPPELLRDLVRRTRERVGNPSVTYRTSYRLAVWSAGRLRAESR